MRSPAFVICNAAALRLASRRVSAFYDSRLAPSGLRATQWAIMHSLRSGEALTVNELAARLELDRTTAGKNIRLLARDGHVTIAPSPQDRRAHAVTPTEQGLKALDHARRLWREAQSEFEALNGPDHAAKLRETLTALKCDD